ncbi:MAG: DUF805 domain-containing protein [Bacteroidota bacterium]
MQSDNRDTLLSPAESTLTIPINLSPENSSVAVRTAPGPQGLSDNGAKWYSELLAFRLPKAYPQFKSYAGLKYADDEDLSNLTDLPAGNILLAEAGPGSDTQFTNGLLHPVVAMEMEWMPTDPITQSKVKLFAVPVATINEHGESFGGKFQPGQEYWLPHFSIDITGCKAAPVEQKNRLPINPFMPAIPEAEEKKTESSNTAGASLHNGLPTEVLIPADFTLKRPTRLNFKKPGAPESLPPPVPAPVNNKQNKQNRQPAPPPVQTNLQNNAPVNQQQSTQQAPQTLPNSPYPAEGTRADRTGYILALIVFTIGETLYNMAMNWIFPEHGTLYYILSVPVLIAYIVMVITAGINRCNDANLNGWWQLIPGITFFAPGTKGPNKYGPEPK